MTTQKDNNEKYIYDTILKIYNICENFVKYPSIYSNEWYNENGIIVHPNTFQNKFLNIIDIYDDCEKLSKLFIEMKEENIKKYFPKLRRERVPYYVMLIRDINKPYNYIIMKKNIIKKIIMHIIEEFIYGYNEYSFIKNNIYGNNEIKLKNIQIEIVEFIKKGNKNKINIRLEKYNQIFKKFLPYH